MKTTRKAIKVVGTETYIKQDTGEIKEMQVIQTEDRDANFHKLWLGHVIQALDLIGNKKIKVLNFIMENLNSENYFLMTQMEMEKKLGISRKTIAETMKALNEANFLKQVRSGTYQINPDVIFKGGKNKRLSVLIEYFNREVSSTVEEGNEEE